MAGEDKATGRCKVCGDRVLITRKATSHFGHGVMTVLTCGIWIPIWVLSSVKVGGWRCATCGSKAEKKMFG